MCINNNQLSVTASVPVMQVNSISSKFVLTLAQQIVNQPGLYPDDFILNINQKTGVLKQTIKNVCVSLHDPKNLSMVEDILKVLIGAMISHDANSRQNLISKFRQLLSKVTQPLMKQTWEDMDRQLMPNINCGKKFFSMYCVPWQIKLKKVIVFAVAYNLNLYLSSMNN